MRKTLIAYFVDKGVESFAIPMSPPLLFDLPLKVPILLGKLEIVPYMLSLDPVLGKATLGWNLFVLGNRRMFLGETHHSDLQGLARQLSSSTGVLQFSEVSRNATREATPKQVIKFILRVLSNSKDGYVDLEPPRQAGQPLDRLYRPNFGSTSPMPSEFFGRRL